MRRMHFNQLLDHAPKDGTLCDLGPRARLNGLALHALLVEELNDLEGLIDEQTLLIKACFLVEHRKHGHAEEIRDKL